MPIGGPCVAVARSLTSLTWSGCRSFCEVHDCSVRIQRDPCTISHGLTELLQRGRKVTAFGVLFDFGENAANTTVQKVKDLISESWVRNCAFFPLRQLNYRVLKVPRSYPGRGRPLRTHWVRCKYLGDHSADPHPHHLFLSHMPVTKDQCELPLWFSRGLHLTMTLRKGLLFSVLFVMSTRPLRSSSSEARLQEALLLYAEH